MKLDRTSYTAVYPRGNYYSGDTIPGMAIRLEDDLVFDETRIIHPLIVESYIQLESQKILINNEIREDGFVIIEPVDSEITKNLTPGRYEYYIKFKLQSGSIKTYVTGYFKILRSE